VGPAPQIRIEEIGHERQPVIVIDDFAPDFAALRAEAEAAAYLPMKGHYPGVRAPVAAETAHKFLAPVQELISSTFGLAGPATLIESLYSIVTTPPERLTPIQRLPHFDGFEAGRIAMVHFLSDGDQGGTAFYRHRATGFETIGAERHRPYDAALHRDVAAHGMPAPAYIAGDTPIFEQISRFSALPNRVLIYRSRALHCADLPLGIPLSPDPRVGRLTVNTFLIGRMTSAVDITSADAIQARLDGVEPAKV
jgi:Family of unknown function (DUF6445)